MNQKTFILRPQRCKEIADYAYAYMLEHGQEYPVQVTVEPYDPKRSIDYNAYYWAAVVTPLAAHLGYTPEEMHEVLLAEVFGIKEVAPLTSYRPIPMARRRSHDMTKSEFRDYVEHCKRISAEQGVPVNES